MKPGSTFHETLHLDLASIYCGPFFTLGKACGKKDCKNKDGVRKKHMGLHRMSDEHRCMQIAHVETNKDNLAFNKMCVRNLPDDKKYLLQMPEGEN